MERLSTLVVQKLLDGFFLGLDAVDAARRQVDRLLGRPLEAPFEVVWPEPQVDLPQSDAPSAAPAETKAAAQPKASPAKKKAQTKPAASSKGSKAGAAKTANKVRQKAPKKATADSPARPKVNIEIEDLATKVKEGKLQARPLVDDDELGGKRMIARVVYVLGAADSEDLGGLSSTEIAHVLTFGFGIETFGTNISRAIRQGMAGMVEALSGSGRIQRYGLSDDGRKQFLATFART